MKMKSDWLLELSAFLYAMLGLCILLVMLGWSKIEGKPIDGTIVTTALLLASSCLLLAYTAFRIRSGSFVQRRNFGIAAGAFVGVMTALAGWFAGVVFGLPLLLAIWGMPDLWKSTQFKLRKRD